MSELKEYMKELKRRITALSKFKGDYFQTEKSMLEGELAHLIKYKGVVRVEV